MKVRVFGTLRAVVGDSKEREVSITGRSTVRQVLDQLIALYPGLREKVFSDGETVQGGIGILVNGRAIRYLKGLNTPLMEDDELALFPPIGGGQESKRAGASPAPTDAVAG